MFVKIKDQRLRMSSIQEYSSGYSTSLDQYFLRLKVGGKERLIHTSNESELSRILEYLDKALKVSEV